MSTPSKNPVASVSNLAAPNATARARQLGAIMDVVMPLSVIAALLSPISGVWGLGWLADLLFGGELAAAALERNERRGGSLLRGVSLLVGVALLATLASLSVGWMLD